ncbi:MAG: hypothetical protein A2Y20_10565 [Firmicutes bacterium GWF2_51_9]|nr:MAG: hypothetical protein A2Y20_10565 [Firmicutes bacterium GWF2_51_9]OGS59474.1 MAG: hypothetical protein A2Y19_10850 [Firmicutes bacterium GWE2_51_13]
MKTQNERYLEEILNLIETDYSADIDLLVLYGSYVNGNTHAKSDVDLFYVPKTSRSQELCKTYLIQDVGYDLFPISWERLENIARLNEFLIPLLVKGKVLYAQSPKEETRFIQLQKQATTYLNDPLYRTKIAKQRIDETTQRLGKMSFLIDHSIILQEAICRIEECIDAVLLSRGIVHLNGIRNFSHDIAQVHDFPTGLTDILDALPHQKVPSICLSLVFEGMRIATSFISSEPPVSKTPKVDDLTAFYQEAISTYHKILAACDADDSRWAYLATAHLQKEMMIVEDEMRIGVLPLLDFENDVSLSDLKQHVSKRWNDIKSKLEELGCDVIGFRDVEDAFKKVES